jgi:hypothetical protein
MVVSSSCGILARARARVQPSRFQRPVSCSVSATIEQGGNGDPGEDRQTAEHLPRTDRVVEGDNSGQRADERLEVDERARELRRHADLRPREQPERDQRAGHGQPEHGGDGTGGDRGRRSAIGEHGDRERRERRGAELDGGDRAGILSREQPRLGHDQHRRARDRREHEQIAGERCAGAASARDEADAGDRHERA